MTLPLCSPILVLVGLLGVVPIAPLIGAAANQAEPALAPPSPSAAEMARAEALVKTGYAAMQASNQDPSKSVEAALAFAEALPVFEAAGLHDRVRELNANIFWSRKRMTHDDLGRYLAAKGGADNEAIAARIEAVVNRQVPLAEADRWLQEVDLFALEHPDRAMQIAIRYFEVAERFAGTPSSLSAQRKSLDYQARAGTAAQQAKRETLFTRPAQVAAGRKPAPDAREIANAVRELKKIYRDGYADRSDDGKRALLRTFGEQARKTKDDPTIAFALYEEAIGLAGQIRAVDEVLLLADAQATAFDVNATQIKKDVLGRMRTSAPAKAVITLLDDPAEPLSNTIAGKYYAFELRRWDVGFAMLSLGQDAALAKLAEMEIAKPQGAQQELELADGWFALGGSRNSDNIACWSRAMGWYESVLPKVEGATKTRVAARMDEMFGVVFPSRMDWDNLTAEQWNKLKPVAQVTVACNTPKTETKVVLRAGQRARVVAHPTDTWTFHSYFSNGPQEVTYKGREYLRGAFIVDQGDDWSFPLGALIMYIDESKKAKAGVIEGPGHVILRSSRPSFGNRGALRVKILLIDP